MKRAAITGMLVGLGLASVSGCAWVDAKLGPDRLVKVEEMGRSNHCNATAEQSAVQILPSASEAVIWQRRNNLDLTGPVTLPSGKYVVVEMGARDRDGFGFVVSPQAQIERHTLRLQATYLTPSATPDEAPAAEAAKPASPCVLLRVTDTAWRDVVVFDQTGKRRARSSSY